MIALMNREFVWASWKERPELVGVGDGG
jgi:hypothetical protein